MTVDGDWYVFSGIFFPSAPVERYWVEVDPCLQNPLQDPLLWCEHWEGHGPHTSLDVRQHPGRGHQCPAGVQRAQASYPRPSVPGEARERCSVPPVGHVVFSGCRLRLSTIQVNYEDYEYCVFWQTMISIICQRMTPIEKPTLVQSVISGHKISVWPHRLKLEEFNSLLHRFELENKFSFAKCFSTVCSNNKVFINLPMPP